MPIGNGFGFFVFIRDISFWGCNKKAGGTSVSPAAVLLILQQSVHIPWVPAVLPRFQNIPALSEVSILQFFQLRNREFPYRCLIFLTSNWFCAPFTFKRRSFNYEKHIFPRIYILNFFRKNVKLFSLLQIGWFFTTWNSTFGTIEPQNRGNRSNYTHPSITALWGRWYTMVSEALFGKFLTVTKMFWVTWFLQLKKFIMWKK